MQRRIPIPVHVYPAADEDVLPYRLRPHPPLEGVETADPQRPLCISVCQKRLEQRVEVLF